MSNAMHVAKTGLNAQNKRMQVISNNLANVNTTGFKRDRATFEDLLYQTVRRAGGQVTADAQAPTGLMLGTGTRILATQKIHAQGNLMQTQNALDLAINGQGFFQILQPDGQIAYTRDGAFNITANGDVVTHSGLLLQPAITIPQNAASITVGNDGTVSVALFDGTEQQIGNLQVARFVNAPGLEPLGQNLYKQTGASGPPVLLQPGLNGAGSLMQGALEASNVNVVEEMVNMIETQRAYEVNSKAISAVDGMLRFINNNL